MNACYCRLNEQKLAWCILSRRTIASEKRENMQYMNTHGIACTVDKQVECLAIIFRSNGNIFLPGSACRKDDLWSLSKSHTLWLWSSWFCSLECFITQYAVNSRVRPRTHTDNKQNRTLHYYYHSLYWLLYVLSAYRSPTGTPATATTARY